MKRFVGLTGAVAVVVCLAAAWAPAAPEPKSIPTEWELDVIFERPQPILVSVPGEDGPQTYWYLLYSVTNNTGADQVFVPRIALYTDTGEIRRGSEGIYPAVFSAIQQRHNNPYLKELSRITGRILQGSDNAKDGVAVFGDFDPKARRIEVFFSGLSGETAVIQLPTEIKVDQIDIRGKTTRILTDHLILHKTLQLSYKIPGEVAARYATAAALDVQTWTMR